uniref:Uncharacterized protein n=1 Tax=Romanomermis culicivorax TaxID=13658 RepID=A0A915J5A0_ROMCU
MDNDHNELHILNQQNGESKAAVVISDPKFVNEFQNRIDKDQNFCQTTISDGGTGKNKISLEKTTTFLNHRPTILNERRKIFDYRVHPEDYHDMLATTCKEGKYKESLIEFSIARLESPHWEFAHFENSLDWEPLTGESLNGEVAQSRIAHLGIAQMKIVQMRIAQLGIAQLEIAHLGIRSIGSIVAVPRVHSPAARAIDAKSVRSTKSKTSKFREMATDHRKNVILTTRIRPTVLNEKRKIFDYWIHPIEYHDMLNDMWKKT